MSPMLPPGSPVAIMAMASPIANGANNEKSGQNSVG